MCYFYLFYPRALSPAAFDRPVIENTMWSEIIKNFSCLRVSFYPPSTMSDKLNSSSSSSSWWEKKEEISTSHTKIYVHLLTISSSSWTAADNAPVNLTFSRGIKVLSILEEKSSWATVIRSQKINNLWMKKKLIKSITNFTFRAES